MMRASIQNFLFWVQFTLFLLPVCFGQQTCNGLANLCDMPSDEILYAMVHNAMSSPSAGFLLFPNHLEDPVVESLDFGYRGLNFDLCNCNGDFEFCHGGDEVGCGIGRRDPVDTFDQINDWIIQNPRNVIIIQLQINEAADGPVTLADVQNILEQVPNDFVSRLYHHDPLSRSSWPTLGELIDAGTQVLFFYTSGPGGYGEHPGGINYFYDFGMATDWSYSDVDDLRDRTLGSCSLRSAGGTRDFFLMNAFVTAASFGIQFMPSRNAAKEINTAVFCGPLLEACEGFQGKKVNIINVDFWSEGNLADLVDVHNAALVPPTPQPVLQPTPAPTTAAPTFGDTDQPSMMPAEAPSGVPTQVPSGVPTQTASEAPSTSTPSYLPSVFATLMPSSSLVPTNTDATTVVSSSPSTIPSDAPSNIPSDVPSMIPSDVPSIYPSVLPTLRPSNNPTNVTNIDDSSSFAPSNAQITTTEVPSGTSIESPSGAKTKYPSSFPTASPNKQKSNSPSNNPSEQTGAPIIITESNNLLSSAANISKRSMIMFNGLASCLAIMAWL